MLSKCANPDCGTAFDYREGRFFRFHYHRGAGEAPANTHSVRHFWLCRACAAIYTLERCDAPGVFLRERSKPPSVDCDIRPVAAA